MSTIRLTIFVLLLGFTSGYIVGCASYLDTGTNLEKPVVHHMKEGFICITYREAMICGQGTNTRPSQNDTSPDETLSVTYSMPLVPSYSTEF